MEGTKSDKWTVKQVLSADSVIVRGVPRAGPPPEKTLGIAGVLAPKLARRPVGDAPSAAPDEPFAWKAREFLREKLVGKAITFLVDKSKNAPSSGGKEYVQLLLGDENIAETLVSEGLVEVRQGPKNDDYLAKLNELQTQARAAKKGKWADVEDAKGTVRDIVWSMEDPRKFVDAKRQEKLKAIVEQVRDGSTIRAFLIGGDQIHYVTVMLSGVRCPSIRLGEGGQVLESEPFADEAKFFTEVHILQREVEVVLESVSNQNFVGSILHPAGNIAEALLKSGYAKCIDWSLGVVSGGKEVVEKYRAAEKEAKTKRLRMWKSYEPPAHAVNGASSTGGDKAVFTAKVVEIANGDALVVKKEPSGEAMKIWLASVRPPRQEGGEQHAGGVGRQFRPLYDIPYMFEAREFLRKRLIGKTVNVTVDYVQPANESAATGVKFGERHCCTVTIGAQNVAEALVLKGLASVVKYRADDENRSSAYDTLLAAEAKAKKGTKGIHAGPEATGAVVRVQDLQGDANRSRQFMPFLQRAQRCEGIVEFVASGSRLRIYIPKETCLLTLLLAGVSCPRASRLNAGAGGPPQPAEPFGDEAMQFTKELCHQHDVEIEVDAIDKGGSFIGWLFVEGINLALALVERGYASVHFTAERSKYWTAIKAAEDAAKAQKLRIWKDYTPPVASETDAQEEGAVDESGGGTAPAVPERVTSFKKVVVTDVSTAGGFRFYVQYVDDGVKLERMMSELRTELSTNAPVVGAYSPRKGDLCAARFSGDGQWYRAKVEGMKSREQIEILYVDFGNRETVSPTKLAALPSGFTMLPHGAHECALAFLRLPEDTDHADLAESAFRDELQAIAGEEVEMNDEYVMAGVKHVTLVATAKGDRPGGDVGMSLVADGLAMADEKRRERRLQKMVTEYKEAQEKAKRQRLNMWRYGDFTGSEI